MTCRHTLRPLALPVLGTLLACQAFAGDCHAQKGRKNTGKEAKQVANQQLNLKEAEALREVYFLLAAANHNYDGHRGKAMTHIQKAIGLLDAKVLAKGTPGQKAATLRKYSATARAKVIAKHAPAIRGPNALSIGLLLKSGNLLARVIPVLRQRNQKAVLEHVNKAEKEIANSLKTR